MRLLVPSTKKSLKTNSESEILFPNIEIIFPNIDLYRKCMSFIELVIWNLSLERNLQPSPC